MQTFLSDEFFSRLEALAINLRTDLAGFFGGKHRVNTYGQTVEFSDYREYMLGDDIRRIDWNLFSRFEKHFIKLFTDERQMQLQVFFDCSSSMAASPTKAAYATAIGAALGFLSVHNMDKVSFKLIQGNFAQDVAGTIVGKNTFFRAVDQLKKIKYDGEADISEAVANCPNPGNNDGLTVIISDFLTENDWKKAVNYLAFKKRQIMLVQVLSPEEIEPLYSGRVTLMDSEAQGIEDAKNFKIRITRGLQKAYEQALRDHQQEIKTFCRARGADFISISCDTPIEKALFTELLKVGIMS
ncbi:MAG: DUF58 domain-containing protein [Firmicutes bacterium]|nr:DUF58 domain-containing protein [Bacillota bacterium]